MENQLNIIEILNSYLILNNNIDITKIEQLKALNSTKRCFILGNGPSINNIDLNVLKDEITIGCNYLLNGLFDKKKDFVPTILCTGDRKCSKDYLSIDYDLIQKKNPIVIFHPSNTDFLDSTKNSKYSTNLLANNKMYCIKNFEKFILTKSLIEKVDLENNIETYCKIYRNVIPMISMLIAKQLGFKEIYLLGCDFTDMLFHFYEFKSHRVKYDKSYKFPTDTIISIYIKACLLRKEEFDKEGINVYNCSNPTNLHVFPKVDFNSLFKQY
jgi:uncharacterized Rossmann fold enzyme